MIDFADLGEGQAIVAGAILGGLIGGLSALVGSLLAHSLERRRAREEERQRIYEWNREQARRDEEWLREKVANTYSDCVYYLIKLSVSSQEKSASVDKDVRQHFSEAQRHLILLRSYRTDDESIAGLEECSKSLAAAVDKTSELSIAAEESVDVVKKLLKTDPRVTRIARSYIEHVPRAVVTNASEADTRGIKKEGPAA